LEEIKKMADNGIGAVVLKSIFEEQIKSEAENIIKNSRIFLILQPSSARAAAVPVRGGLRQTPKNTGIYPG
jgi:hypothetical protein